MHSTHPHVQQDNVHNKNLLPSLMHTCVKYQQQFHSDVILATHTTATHIQLGPVQMVARQEFNT